MSKFLKKLINKFFSIFNLKITKLDDFIILNRSVSETDPCMEPEFKKIYENIEKFFGKADPVPAYTVYKTIRYISENNIDGDIVECGVFRGRMVAVIMETLNQCNDLNRNIYLYDTFQGMTPGTDIDYQVFSSDGKKIRMQKGENYCDINQVRKNLSNFKYQKEKIVFEKGDVKFTLNSNVPNKIALLRLDTDFYESSLIELEKLYDKVNLNGFVIYDDYGHWMGQYKATNEFFNKKKLKPFLIRTSRKERLEIKKLSIKK